MIPSALVAQLQQGMRDFLRASFWTTTPEFEPMLDGLIEGDGGREEHPLFRGPYVSMKLPFETGSVGTDFFEELPTAFPPYKHQEQAFRRLSEVDGSPRRSTLVATGTGSGKTESFLYPILAHCLKHREQRGIKAILIYPMNALAQDQAERLARMIHAHEGLRTHVRAGLYVGSESAEVAREMGPNTIITDKKLLRETPPDILLTNYKMLDYLMIRPGDQVIWQWNDPQTLQYLVVDELHTFDGAQGTDLASLIRRLKARLKTPQGHLTCVGTSATMGEGRESAERLRHYAGAIFGETFDEDAVIEESRVSKDHFLSELQARRGALGLEAGEELDQVPDVGAHGELLPTGYSDPHAYLSAQQRIWFGREFGSAAELGQALVGHFMLDRLLYHVGTRPRSLSDLVEVLRTEAFASEPVEVVEAALLSFISLVAAARDEGGARPFLHVRVELWQRELRRMVASVGEHPKMAFHDDLTKEQRRNHLPVVYCRECGTMGWATLIEKDKPLSLSCNLQSFYAGYFSNDERVAFFFPRSAGVEGDVWHVPGTTLERRREPPTAEELQEEGGWVEAIFTDNTYESGERGTRSHTDCPGCQAKSSLSLMGFQAASLTSAYINQLFSSRFNDDKKLLTFSDSVQDAAHRAGFFEARTWRFNLRVAIQRVVEDNAEDMSFETLTERVVDYWTGELGQEGFAAVFCPPDMAWLSEYQALLAEEISETQLAKLIELIRRRVQWEVVAEYTYIARIGRTLPRTGASVAYADPQKIEEALGRVVARVSEEVGGMRELEVDDLRPAVMGLCRRMMQLGAIFEPSLTEAYRSSGGEKTFTLGRINHLPRFGPRSRLPAFLCNRPGTRRFESYVRRGKQTWYDTYLQRALEAKVPLLADDTASYVWTAILEELTRVGLLQEEMQGGTRLWGFGMDALRVTRNVALLKEQTSGSVVAVAEHEAQSWLGAPALGPMGGGHAPFEGEHDAYYRALYRGGEVSRIVAREHTGLLERPVREDVEQRFKSRDGKLWDPNLLSCTPTLEMGIDVGDLSTAILCSVPPSQANYLQRIGRAGRRDGNALLLTLAGARDHDIYFFLEPEEMIAGHVATPGVFLNASAVLERQLTAFAFDRWAASGVAANALPPRVGFALKQGDANAFPNNLVNFIESQRDALFEAFVELFDAHLSEESRAYLRRFLYGDGTEFKKLSVRIVEAFDDLRVEIRDLDLSTQRMKRAIDQLEAEKVRDNAQEEELDAMKKERTALRRLIVKIKERNTMEYLTTRGLLPNYAFPEAGVILQSVVWRRRGEEERGDGKYVTFEYEYERPTSAAIKDFAPRNIFYAGGRQVEVDRIGIDAESVESWQFCDVCHYAEMVQGKSDSAKCPHCGSAQFGDVAGQVHQMVRLRQVFANTNDRKSRIGDESDERKPRFYNRRMLVTRRGESRESHAIDDATIPFGYEYVPRTDFREINFGESSGSDHGRRGTIAGVENIHTGFRVCADCGKVQSELRAGKDAVSEHSFGCVSRTQKRAEKIIECLFLYRDFQAESVHLLLPFAKRPGFEEKMQSFIAAFQMGMREFFGGQVDHLASTSYIVPGKGDEPERLFLVLYDQVPGGTGYLNDLMRPNADGGSKIFEILELALERLTSCRCNADPRKDGCYRCLFAYRNSFEMPSTSRNTAVEVFGELLQARGKLKPVESLNAVSVTGLAESHLEARFREALRKSPGITMSSDLIQSRAGHRLNANGSRWQMFEQVNWDKSATLARGVSIDFLIEPAPGGAGGTPLAIFTDGYQYHKARIAEDLHQRMALAVSGRAHPWSLTWHDLDHALAEGDDEAAAIWPTNETVDDLLKMFAENLGVKHLTLLPGMKSFELLRSYLDLERHAGEPGETSPWLTMIGTLVFVSSMDMAQTAADRESFAREAREALPPAIAEDLLDGMPEGFMGKILQGPALPAKDGQERVAVRTFIVSDRTFIGVDTTTTPHQKTIDPTKVRVAVLLDDENFDVEETAYRRVWNGVLRLHNLLHLLPHCWMTTTSSAARFNYSDIIATRPRRSGASDGEWEAARDAAADVELGLVVDRLFEAGAPLPAVGDELLDKEGFPKGPPADLSWKALKIAVVYSEEDKAPYVEEGWRVFLSDEVSADPTELLAALNAASAQND
ncbi:DEAD/DEAH box helicase [Lujinxingia vulgaris]|uniref:DEAD/DEAH box helicase n=1 Tax=Lujinxingia vulgaris TaxID=2600176 RepID=A0A5C6X6Z7_9DELT|nr:DEAD/DEAH box helicase [Lujinxingia vulgaris]TXD33785.1 DEAD/DEAH box helicase [Lujinxingia vulgaris]